jgi:hypothetical protein
MRTTPTWLLLAGLFFVGVAQGKPVLAVVKIKDRDQIQVWRRLAIPTYAYDRGLAIAEFDDARWPELKRLGFAGSVVDESPGSSDYYYGRVPDAQRNENPGSVIYEDGDFFIFKARLGQDTNELISRLRLARLTNLTLGERFWENAARRIVSVDSLPWDPFIQGLVDQVNADSITADIQRLQDFKSRLFLLDSCYAAEEWLRQKYTGWGYPVEFDSFFLNLIWPRAGWDRNVIATKAGSLIPSRIVIVGGHHDCIVWPDSATARTNAPGADDNGTGAAATMEIARIFRNYSWEPTVIFCGWAAEEMGLYGSHHFAAWADSQDLDIQAVVIMDMIGYMNDTILDGNIENHGSFTLGLSRLVKLAGQTYAPALALFEVSWPGGSDDLPFYQHGFPATCNIERWYYQNPNYHKVTDVISNTTANLYVNMTRACLAAVAVLGLYPGTVANAAARDFGDGQRLLVSWTANPEGDVIGYRVYWGRQSGVYSDSGAVAGLTDTLAGLIEDSLYYIAVRAVDAAGHVSPLADEVSDHPQLLPRAPGNIQATPVAGGVRVDWLRNEELDLAGYRLYRRINQNPVYDSLSTGYLTDTSWSDQPLSGADKYYYAVRAFDTNGNPSPMSAEVYGRPITLDQGILIIDETQDSSSLADSLSDRFYNYILSGYPHTLYDNDSTAARPVLADFAPYSVVAWHSDDQSDFLAPASVSDLKAYLNAGGKLWFMGWKPTADLRDSALYPVDFAAGDFIYDYLGIEHADISALGDSFRTAVGALGYPDVSVDSAKVPNPAWGGTMRYIEALTAVRSGQAIYQMDMINDSSPFEGKTCGVRNLSGQSRTVFLGFPLYYMDRDQARRVAQKVLQDFGEVVVKETDARYRISDIGLLPNRPNPFTKNTVIRYQLPCSARVGLKIYNIAGQLIRTLVIRDQAAGSYSVIWNGLDENGRVVGCGVYFYRLTANSNHATRKMIVVR